MPKRPSSLKSRALQLIAQREQSRLELRRKLLAHVQRTVAAGAPVDGEDDASGAAERAGAEVDAVLDWLEANNFLDAGRFVESRVSARLARFGNLRIRGELAMHAVALDPATAQTLADSELGRARAVRARKFREPPSSAAERARQARFLGARGFSGDVIRAVLREAANGPAEDV